MVSVTGVTGAKDKVNEKVERLIQQLKEVSSVPVGGGVGWSGKGSVMDKETKRAIAHLCSAMAPYIVCHSSHQGNAALEQSA